MGRINIGPSHITEHTTQAGLPIEVSPEIRYIERIVPVVEIQEKEVVIEKPAQEKIITIERLIEKPFEIIVYQPDPEQERKIEELEYNQIEKDLEYSRQLKILNEEIEQDSKRIISLITHRDILKKQKTKLFNDKRSLLKQNSFLKISLGVVTILSIIINLISLVG